MSGVFRPAFGRFATLAALAACTALSVPAVPAMAQGLGTSALKGLNDRTPIDVDADSIDVFDQQNRAIFRGHVQVRQSSLSMQADQVIVTYSRSGDGAPEVQRLNADGHVQLRTPTENATARYGIYDVDKRLLTLIGNVVLIQGTTHVEGNRLVINLTTGRSTLDGSSAAGTSGQRVSGRFAVPERRKQGQ